jgi:hypothetical protein
VRGGSGVARLPVARERGLRPVVSHTYIRTCDSTYTHIHDERHRYPGALNSHLIASNDNEEREYPSHIPAQLPHPPLLQPPVRPLTCPIAMDTTLPGSGGLYLFRVNVKVRDSFDYFGMCTDPKRIDSESFTPVNPPADSSCTPPNAARAVWTQLFTHASRHPRLVTCRPSARCYSPQLP